MTSLDTSERRTEVLRGREKVLSTTLHFLASAKMRMDICTAAITPRQPQGTEGMGEAYLEIGKRGGRLRLLTVITNENASQCRELMKAGVELRHLDSIESYFGVSDSEYLATPGTEEFNQDGPLLYSNDEHFVRHQQGLFDMLWEKAIPADLRIKQLEEGEEIGETSVTFDTSKILETANGFVDDMKKEALIIVPREGSINDNLAFFQKIDSKARKDGVKVRMLGSFSDEGSRVMERFGLQGVEIRRLATSPFLDLGLGIYDGKGMVIAQYLFTDRTRRPPGQSYLSGVLSTNRATIAGIAAIFESLWEEAELREGEERSRKEAELMQDILTHDMRNFIQIIQTNTELVEGKLGTRPADEKSRDSLRAILRAIDGSSRLINNARTLGRIRANRSPVLSPVDLGKSLERAFLLVKRSNPGRTIVVKSRLPRAMVVADELLDEVFINILYNSVRYTDSKRVPIEMSLKGTEGLDNPDASTRAYWKVTVTDRGRGIPDEMKMQVSTRYQQTGSVGGLGLSIAHALVVERYRGKLEIGNRVKSDYTRGTKVEVSLPKAT